jgi:hypothetical protein
MSAGPADVNPADYDLPSSSHWDPPDWLLKFARDHVWPFVDSRPRAELIAALNRWLGCHAEKDEFLRQLALLDKERRRLAYLDGLEECERLLAAQIDDRIAHLAGAYNEPPLDLPFPPPRERTLSRDASLVALMALNDETRDHSQRIGPTDSSLYAIVCAEVRKLKRMHLAGLQAMITTAQQSPPPADERRRGRPRRYNWQEDQEVAERWKRARDAGIEKKDFAGGEHLTLTKLNRILNRHAKRKKRAQE